MSYLSGNETITYTGHRLVTLELAKEEDLGGAQILKNAFVMKEAFYNYAGSIRHTKLPAQYKVGFFRNRHLRLRASKSLRAVTGVIVLSVLSGVQERLTVMVHLKKGISTSHNSICVVLQKLKKVLLS